MISAPSSTSMVSSCLARSRLCSRSAVLVTPLTRLRIGQVYQEPRNTPTLPRGGRARQKRHIIGRSSSSSEGSPMPWLWMWRGSIHSLSRLTVAPRPEPSRPPMRMITANRADCANSSWASSRSARRAGTSFSYTDFLTLCPSSALSNIPGLPWRWFTKPSLAGDGAISCRLKHTRSGQATGKTGKAGRLRPAPWSCSRRPAGCSTQRIHRFLMFHKLPRNRVTQNSASTPRSSQ